jgi:hypothetical protein
MHIPPSPPTYSATSRPESLGKNKQNMLMASRQPMVVIEMHEVSTTEQIFIHFLSSIHSMAVIVSVKKRTELTEITELREEIAISVGGFV